MWLLVGPLILERHGGMFLDRWIERLEHNPEGEEAQRLNRFAGFMFQAANRTMISAFREGEEVPEGIQRFMSYMGQVGIAQMQGLYGSIIKKLKEEGGEWLKTQGLDDIPKELQIDPALAGIAAKFLGDETISGKDIMTVLPAGLKLMRGFFGAVQGGKLPAAKGEAKGRYG